MHQILKICFDKNVSTRLTQFFLLSIEQSENLNCQFDNLYRK